MNDFKIILEAMIDNSSLTNVQKQLAKERLKVSADIDFSNFVSEKQKIQQLANEINKILGDSLKPKDALSWANQYWKQMQSGAIQAQREQEKLNQAQKKSSLATQEKYYQRIINNNKTIYSLKEKLLRADEKQSQEIQNQITKLEKRNQYNYGQLNKKGLTDNSWEWEVNTSKEVLENRLRINQEKQKDIALSKQIADVDKIQHSLDVGDYDTQLKAYSTALQKAGMEGQELATKINGAKTALEELRKSATAENIIPSDVDEKFTKLRTEFEKLANDVKNVKLDNSLFADDIKVNDTITRLNEQLRKNGAYSTSAKIKIQEWIRELEKGDVAEARLKEINSEAKELHSNMAKLGNIGKSRWQTFTEYVRSFSEWMISSGAVLEVVQGVKTATNNVIKLSNSLLELSKVSDLSEGGLLKVTERAYELSKVVGKTGTQVLDAVTEFKRAGYDMDKSFNMAEAAMVMTNVAENIKETSDAAGTLISVLKGFNMAETDAMKIVDMINSTSNQSPIGFDQLAEGLERTAGTLAQSGNSIQQTIGLLTAGYAQLRNVEKVSQGLITISARIRGVGEDGETIDGLASKMSEDFGKIGVAVENADGSLRSIYQIAQDYSKVLPNLTDKQKQYYAELAAGKHQVTVWNAIVKQFEDAEKATAQAIDSVGSASEENQKYLDSISGKISIFQSAIEKLSNTVLNSKILSFFVDLGTVGVNSLTSLIEKSRELISGFELIGTALGTFIQSKSKSGGLMSC